MLSSLPPNRSLISFFSLATLRSKIFAIRPRTNMFLPLSCAVPPSASTVETGNRHADIDETLVVGSAHVIGIVEQDAALLQEADVVLVAVVVKATRKSASSPATSTSPEPMRTWKIDGPPEIVDGMVMKVMTSCSLRPASRARKAPTAWMPSCELPAMRITAS